MSTPEIIDAGPDDLVRYGQIPIALRVESVLRVLPVDGGLGGLVLREEPVDTPYVKDYDARAGEGPSRWLSKFDMRGWGVFLAVGGDGDLGGAIVAPGKRLSGPDPDWAQLFDIRVRPDALRTGVGRSLFGRVVEWSRGQGARHLQIETQNTNVRACRFYAAMGCTLAAIDRHAYAAHPDIAHESRVLWHLGL